MIPAAQRGKNSKARREIDELADAGHGQTPTSQLPQQPCSVFDAVLESTHEPSCLRQRVEDRSSVKMSLVGGQLLPSVRIACSCGNGLLLSPPNLVGVFPHQQLLVCSGCVSQCIVEPCSLSVELMGDASLAGSGISPISVVTKALEVAAEHLEEACHPSPVEDVVYLRLVCERPSFLLPIADERLARNIDGNTSSSSQNASGPSVGGVFYFVHCDLCGLTELVG